MRKKSHQKKEEKTLKILVENIKINVFMRKNLPVADSALASPCSVKRIEKLRREMKGEAQKEQIVGFKPIYDPVSKLEADRVGFLLHGFYLWAEYLLQIIITLAYSNFLLSPPENCENEFEFSRLLNLQTKNTLRRQIK